MGGESRLVLVVIVTDIDMVSTDVKSMYIIIITVPTTPLPNYQTFLQSSVGHHFRFSEGGGYCAKAILAALKLCEKTLVIRRSLDS